MNSNLIQTKDEDNVLHILNELAKKEGVTPTMWLRIRIMQEAKRKGLINPAEPIESKHINKETSRSPSTDQFVWED